MKFNKEEIILFLKQNFKIIAAAFLCSVLFVAAGFYYFSSSSSGNNDNINFNVQKSSEDNQNGEQKEDENKIFVDVKGAVKNPGVYETTKEKRVKDIIEEAGGLLEDADTSNINLSQKLRDQMVIYILKKGEKPKQIGETSSVGNLNDAIININTASKEQLMKISGIGKTKAEAILAYREKNGEFKKKEDITKVRGIGKATFDKIKDKIEV